jgi:uncharacterized protein (TIGR00661 family)
MLSHKRILICPLDWGLGHATRCIPIIRMLLLNNADVIIAGDGASADLLKIEFPQLQFIPLKGYRIRYSEKGNMALKMLVSTPKIIFRIIQEHIQLKKIIQQNHIDIVISDNRYGLWNKNIKSIFITHQLMIKSPFLEYQLYLLVLYFVRKYDVCWIPDLNDSENNLSGDLSHKYKLPSNALFVGPLSRFNNTKEEVKFQYDVLAIVSGPEPQRSIFEAILISQLKQIKLKSFVVCGKPHELYCERIIDNVNIVSHLKSDALQEVIEQSKFIISRSGYSTIMDLAILGKKAFFVPTPGQTEQKYLAERLTKMNIFYSQKQDSFNISHAITKSSEYKGIMAKQDLSILLKSIANL